MSNKELICPQCGQIDSFVTGKRLSFPGDSWWDEISLGLVRCANCQITVLRFYREERRGRLDGEHWEIEYFQVPAALYAELEAKIVQCPKLGQAGERYCDCPVHQALGVADEQGNWNGVPGLRNGFYEEIGFS